MKTLQAFLAAALVAIMPCVASAATYTMRAQVSGMEPKAPAAPEVHYVGRWSAYQVRSMMNAYPTEASARNIAVEFSTDDIAYFSTSTSTNRDEAFSQSQVPGMGCNEIGSKQAFGVYLHDAHGNWYPIYFDVTCTEQT